MSLYLFSLVVGTAGLVLMALTGVARLGHSPHHAGASGHAGHGGHGPGGHAGHTAGSRGLHLPPASPAKAARASGSGSRSLSAALWSLTSPRTLFSLGVGFGAVGLILRPLLPAPLVVAGALAGAGAFEFVLLRPLWNWLLRFESTPALTLESAIYDEARAITGFDERGQGMIALELDGHMVQLLATLLPEDQNHDVRSGDLVRIEEVDSKRNRCVVSYIGRA